MLNLEIERITSEISKNQAKTVLLQLPDGLKPKAKEIVDAITKKTDSDVLIWGGSCFGACDIPNVKADLIIQWGHSEWM